MKASLVRFGGIAVFAGLALAVPLSFLLSGSGFERFLIGPLQTSVMVFVLWATKTYMNEMGFHKADLALYIMIALHVLISVVDVVFNTRIGVGSIVEMRWGAIDGIGVVNLIVSLLMVVSWVWFALMAVGFGNLGGGLWKVIGILYLIAFGCVIALTLGILFVDAAVFGMLGAATLLLVLYLASVLMFLAAFICHGIGLILGAGRMKRLPNPADAF